MNTNRNLTQHFELHFADGTVVAEQSRRSFGAWVRMAARIEARFGGRLRMADATHGTVAGLSFTVVEVG